MVRLAHVDPANPARVGVQLQVPANPAHHQQSLIAKLHMMLLKESWSLFHMGLGVFLFCIRLQNLRVLPVLFIPSWVWLASQDSTAKGISWDFFLAEVDCLWLGESDGICRRWPVLSMFDLFFFQRFDLMFDVFFLCLICFSMFCLQHLWENTCCAQLGVQEFLAGLSRQLSLMSDCCLVSSDVLFCFYTFQSFHGKWLQAYSVSSSVLFRAFMILRLWSWWLMVGPQRANRWSLWACLWNWKRASWTEIPLGKHQCQSATWC